MNFLYQKKNAAARKEFGFDNKKNGIKTRQMMRLFLKINSNENKKKKWGKMLRYYENIFKNSHTNTCWLV